MKKFVTEVRARVRSLLAWVGHGIGSLVIAMWKRPGGVEVPVSVHLLVSSRTWHGGVLAAISFELLTGRRWKLFVHDDGTVDEVARKRIEKTLSGVRFVPRAEAEVRAREYLADHPKSLEHRSRHNLFLKLFDVPAFASNSKFIMLDSDVIFFRPPQEILDWALSGSEECRYNEDTKEKYFIPRPIIEETFGFPVWKNFNSGLVLMPMKAVDLDLADRVLTTFEDTAYHPQFFEQTLYGLMGSAWNRGGPLPRKYEINWGYLRGPGAVCRHYVGAFKHDLLYIEGAPILALNCLRWRLFLL
jgi:hypothetical protein